MEKKPLKLTEIYVNYANVNLKKKKSASDWCAFINAWFFLKSKMSMDFGFNGCGATFL